MRLAFAAALASLASPAFAQPAPVVGKAWARATSDLAQTGAAYLAITSPDADQLVGLASPAARQVELHESMDDHGVMKMRAVPMLPLPPGAEVRLAPGGYHAMLMGLTRPLHVGDHFPLTLTFQHAGAVTTDVVVERAGAMRADEMPAGVTDHSKQP